MYVKWLCCSLNNTNFSCAATAYTASEIPGKMVKCGFNHIEKQAGIPSLLFPYIPTTCAPISVYSHSTFELKTQNQTLKCWQYEMHGKAGAGTHQEQAGLRVLSQQGSCSELIVWESHKQHG